MNWKKQKLGRDIDLRGVTYGNGLFVAVGSKTVGNSSEGFIFTSQDGINWTRKRIGKDAQFRGVTYGNGLFIAVMDNDTILISKDGVQWTKPKTKISNVKYVEDYFIATGTVKVRKDGTYYIDIYTSKDGINWNKQSSNFHYFFNDFAYGNGLFVGVGAEFFEEGDMIGDVTYSDYIYVSKDGKVWNKRKIGAKVILYGITYGDGLFVAVGEELREFPNSDSVILTSKDGINWKKQNVGKDIWLRGITYANGLFVVVGWKDNDKNNPDLILISRDGEKWTRAKIVE